MSSDAIDARATFNDTRCKGGDLVCPRDPLLFTCLVTASSFSVAVVYLPDYPGSPRVSLRDSGMVRGEEALPEGVTVSNTSVVVVRSVGIDYLLQLQVEGAGVLGGGQVCCDPSTVTLPDKCAQCSIAEGE